MIQGVQLKPLRRFADDRGYLMELVRADDPFFTEFGQTVVTMSYPGVIKAFHLHVRQTDVWYVPPGDRMLIVLIDVRQGSRTEGTRMRLMLGDGASRLLRIPPGVAHGVRNLGPAPGRVVYFTDLHFSAEPSSCDEGRLPWDFAGAAVWEVSRG